MVDECGERVDIMYKSPWIGWLGNFARREIMVGMEIATISCGLPEVRFGFFGGEKDLQGQSFLGSFFTLPSPLKSVVNGLGQSKC